MSDKKPSNKTLSINNYTPGTDQKNYTPSTSHVQGNHTPTTSQGANSTPPSPKKK
jgi:hypothetical protein